MAGNDCCGDTFDARAFCAILSGMQEMNVPAALAWHPAYDPALDACFVFPTVTADFSLIVLASQPAATDLTLTVNDAEYETANGWCTAHLKITLGEIGTAGQEFKIAAPFLPNPASVNAGESCGTFTYNDAGTKYVGAVDWDGDYLQFVVHNAASRLGVTPSFATAINDTMSLTVRFRFV